MQFYPRVEGNFRILERVNEYPLIDVTTSLLDAPNAET